MPDPVNHEASLVILPLDARTASPETIYRLIRAVGAHVIIRINSAPGSGQTLTPRIVGVDALGDEYPLLTGPALIAPGTTILRIGPGLLPVPNAIAADRLPPVWGVAFDHSGAGSWTYSATVNVHNG